MYRIRAHTHAKTVISHICIRIRTLHSAQCTVLANVWLARSMRLLIVYLMLHLNSCHSSLSFHFNFGCTSICVVLFHLAATKICSRYSWNASIIHFDQTEKRWRIHTNCLDRYDAHKTMTNILKNCPCIEVKRVRHLETLWFVGLMAKPHISNCMWNRMPKTSSRLNCCHAVCAVSTALFLYLTIDGKCIKTIPLTSDSSTFQAHHT